MTELKHTEDTSIERENHENFIKVDIVTSFYKGINLFNK